MNNSVGKSTSKRLLNSCEEMLVLAARDLAVLTKIGIHASDIVDLAHTYESLQEISSEESGSNSNKQQYLQLKEHLLNGIYRICKRAIQVKDQSLRRYRYKAFITETKNYLQGFAEREAPAFRPIASKYLQLIS